MIEEMFFLGKNLHIDINQVNRAAEYIEENNSLAGYPSWDYVLDRIIDNLKTIVLDEGVTSIGSLGYQLIASSVDGDTVQVEIMVDPALADAKIEEETLDRTEGDNAFSREIAGLFDQISFDENTLQTIRDETLEQLTFGPLEEPDFSEHLSDLDERIKALEECACTEGEVRFHEDAALRSDIDSLQMKVDNSEMDINDLLREIKVDNSEMEIYDLRMEIQNIKRVVVDMNDRLQGITPVKFSDIF